jgi:hypothetical protein
MIVQRNGQNEWEPWFAWFPVFVEYKTMHNGDELSLRTRVWWELVERREGNYFGDCYEYRLPISMGV